MHKTPHGEGKNEKEAKRPLATGLQMNSAGVSQKKRERSRNRVGTHGCPPGRGCRTHHACPRWSQSHSAVHREANGTVSSTHRIPRKRTPLALPPGTSLRYIHDQGRSQNEGQKNGEIKEDVVSMTI